MIHLDLCWLMHFVGFLSTIQNSMYRWERKLFFSHRGAVFWWDAAATSCSKTDTVKRGEPVFCYWCRKGRAYHA
ncbi:hypothetical protein FRX31_007111 [Thalictrum thalictroides]|uniref:Secreted protein n=1 Tax=Thalictrum thalictroides TaxID=46969 RepID=A0A7J6X0Q4_THATH|nr:hypothetical protein FRX31_007111 [Thalictrum thalictroides]